MAEGRKKWPSASEVLRPALLGQVPQGSENVTATTVEPSCSQKKPPFVLLEMDFRWDSLISKWVSKAAQAPDLPGRFLGRCLDTQSTRRVGNRTCPTGETLGYLSLFQISVQRKRKKKKNQNKTDFVYICFS